MTANGKFCSITLFVLLLLIAGCDRQTRYAVVTTLFTGVPPIEEYYADKKETPEENAPIGERELPAPVFSHTFFEEGKCDVCHTLTQDELPPPVRPDNTSNSEDKREEGLISAPLRVPSQKLCLECHIDKSPRQAIRKRLLLHSPVASGNCLGCHAAHSSAQQSLLIKEPAEICTTCHEVDQDILPADCFRTPPGYETKEAHCLACHNPHMGKNNSLLTRDYKEEKRLTVKRSISGAD